MIGKLGTLWAAAKKDLQPRRSVKTADPANRPSSPDNAGVSAQHAKQMHTIESMQNGNSPKLAILWFPKVCTKILMHMRKCLENILPHSL